MPTVPVSLAFEVANSALSIHAMTVSRAQYLGCGLDIDDVLLFARVPSFFQPVYLDKIPSEPFKMDEPAPLVEDR